MAEEAAGPSKAIEDDVACRHCGYNLRTLWPDGQCPECGTAISESLRGDLLQFAEPQWLEKLHRGVVVKLWIVALTILFSFGMGIAGAMGLSGAMPGPYVMATLTAITLGGLGLWASFLITAQEPRISLSEDPMTLRRVIRVCALLSAIGYALPNYGGTPGVALFVLTGVAKLAWVVLVTGELVYLRRLGLRIPDAALAESTRLLSWFVPIGVGLFFLFGVAAAVIVGAAAARGRGMPAGAAVGSTPLSIVFIVGGCVMTVGGLVVLLWYVRLLTRYKSAFSKALWQARASVTGVASYDNAMG